MKRHTLGQRFRYWFDNTMARGTSAMIAWLAVVSISLVFSISTLIVVFDNKPSTAGRALGEIWKNTVDTFKLGDATEGNTGVRVLAILLAMAGIFFASTLIGLITSGVNQRIKNLRKGRSAVLETGHTVLLGWSDQVFPILKELIEANANQRRACVAILADKDRTEMEDEIRKRIGRKTGTTRVVCRTGSPMDPSDIDIVSPQTSRSVIVLTPRAGNPDTQVAKSLLALTNSPTRGSDPYHVVTSVQDARNRTAAQLAGGKETLVVDGEDIAARLIVQTCRQSGLSVVYQDLLDFAGDEVYMQEVPELVGRTFGQSLSAFRTSAVIGVQSADGTIKVNPAKDLVFAEGDRVIAVTADDDTIVIADDQVAVDEAAITAAPPRVQRPERALMLGWNRRAGQIVRELDAYVAPGSFLDIIADDPDAKPELELLTPLAHLGVSFELGDTDDRSCLDTYDIASYDQIIVLCYGNVDPELADSRALITLLHLRQMQQESGKRFSIVSEMTDDRNRRLAQVTKADDFIVSQQLISLLMVQLSENRHLHAVFADLFDSAGSEVYLKPAEDYIVPGSTVDFYTVVEAALRKGQCAIGYKLADESQTPPTFGVHLNPDKSERVMFGAGDKVIVVAEE